MILKIFDKEVKKSCLVEAACFGETTDGYIEIITAEELHNAYSAKSIDKIGRHIYEAIEQHIMQCQYADLTKYDIEFEFDDDDDTLDTKHNDINDKEDE